LARLLRLFTFLPCEEIDRLTAPHGNINRAKEILAFEATALNHGPSEAASVYALACQQFGCADAKGEVVTSSTITQAGIAREQSGPELTLAGPELGTLTWAQLLVRAELAGSGGEARRLIQGGGARFGAQVLSDPHAKPGREELSIADAVLRAGKKRFCRVRLLV
jgi:tyrosyl-tRNA synthetase